jgi:hypothetical protein
MITRIVQIWLAIISNAVKGRAKGDSESPAKTSTSDQTPSTGTAKSAKTAIKPNEIATNPRLTEALALRNATRIVKMWRESEQQDDETLARMIAELMIDLSWKTVAWTGVQMASDLAWAANQMHDPDSLGNLHITAVEQSRVAENLLYTLREVDGFLVDTAASINKLVSGELEATPDELEKVRNNILTADQAVRTHIEFHEGGQ